MNDRALARERERGARVPTVEVGSEHNVLIRLLSDKATVEYIFAPPMAPLDRKY